MYFNKIIIMSFFLIFISQQAFADKNRGINSDDGVCQVGFVTTDIGLDYEFGFGASDKTTCLKKRNEIKIVMQLNKSCRDSYTNSDGGKVINNIASCSRPYALGNLNNMLNDYTITNGIAPENIDIKVIVHSGGGFLMLKNTGYDGKRHEYTGVDDNGRNKFQTDVEGLIDRGVKFYFCQNTTRGFIKKGILPAGDATAQLIDGVEYVTAGVTALADLQEQGYKYVQP